MDTVRAVLFDLDDTLTASNEFAADVLSASAAEHGVAITAEYFQSTFRNMIDRINVAVSASDYTPVSIYNPVTGGSVTAATQGFISGIAAPP